jgi:hypothetical protein
MERRKVVDRIERRAIEALHDELSEGYLDKGCTVDEAYDKARTWLTPEYRALGIKS